MAINLDAIQKARASAQAAITPKQHRQRGARARAHQTFDRLWQEGHMSRNQAYAWLAGSLGLTLDQAHIRLFDEARCEQVIAISAVYLRKVRR